MALTKITRAILDTGISDSSDATAITIDSSENVGIGTTSPSAELHIHDEGGLSRIRLTGTASAADNFEFGQGTTGVTNGGFEIRDVDASATRFLIDASGNVGIGVTSLSQKFEVNGNVGLTDNLGVGTGSSSPNSRLQIKKDGTGNYANQTFTNANSTAGITFGIAGSGTGNYLADNAFLLNTGSSAFIFGTGDVERMRIDSTGRVLVGNTNGLAKFSVGNGSGNALIEMASQSATSVYYEHINRSNTNGSVDVGYYARNTGDHKFYTGSYTVRFTINENGGSNGSDEKLKKDIENISYGLETVKSLQPRKFKWKETDNDGIGFIAQEVESLIPEVVADTTDAKEETDEVTKVLNYANLTAVLTKAIQELSAKVEELEKKV